MLWSSHDKLRCALVYSQETEKNDVSGVFTSLLTL